MFEIVYDDDDGRRRTDGHRLDGYTKSSPCEPNGSGELIKMGHHNIFVANKASSTDTLRSGHQIQM